jgi:hypothetical protein
MSELLWKCQDGAVFSSHANGLRLEVARVSRGNGFRYQLIGQCAATQHDVALASGHRDELTDALDAAERTARGFARTADAAPAKH